MSESQGGQVQQGEQQIPLSVVPASAYPQPLLGNTPIRDLQAKAYIFAVVVIILGVFVVVRLVKWVDQTSMRVDVLELKNRIYELEKVRPVSEQVLNNLTQSHNGLVKATENMVNQLHARIGALESKAAEEAAKVGAEKKAIEEAAKIEAEKNKGWFGSKEAKKK